MTKKMILLVTALALCVLFLSTGIGFTQESATDRNTKQITIKGKISYQENLWGYYVQGENPPAELFIVNQNKKILEKLKKNGKTVTIEGHLTIGADHLMIEKINGKKYFGDKPK